MALAPIDRPPQTKGNMVSMGAFFLLPSMPPTLLPSWFASGLEFCRDELVDTTPFTVQSEIQETVSQ
jgi:hypothetical protein